MSRSLVRLAILLGLASSFIAAFPAQDTGSHDEGTPTDAASPEAPAPAPTRR